MIKSDAVVMQTMYQSAEVDVSTERRIFLARKGQVLYGKYCGTHGEGICAESFVEYHVWRGELVVAQDFLAFLAVKVASLRQTVADDTKIADQLHMTEQLIGRIENLIGTTSDTPLLLALEANFEANGTN